ncbi:aldehyde dehydrogenase family protein [Actinomadura bangladeshensis]|uniref:Aldehyde dehydrogenase family protein n=1 Tax=Actinomadura bangladeshensis TaxID=453573 RepID=A0A4R4P9C4_9ACTN|nr:aldehyde dehydrogenase family protein [Actinomadura bangladeshensis]TDC17570.1 aldehyde dehydrogenase family protein [Actinomadura bangladeshensis]
MARGTMLDVYTGFDRMPIAGEWRAGRSDGRREDTDPYTGEVLTEIGLAGADDLDEAYRAARDAQPAWAARPAAERAEVMANAARIMADREDELIGWLQREAGATRGRAGMELALVRAVTEKAAEQADRINRWTGTGSDIPDKENRVYRKAAGVVGVISPWNFPVQLSNRSVAPALALGNAVVLKPASDTPVTGGLFLAKVYEEAGLPPGLLSALIGRGSEIGDAFVEHEIPRVISFTGSTPVGRGIAAKAGLKELALELGGNGPLVVLDDADLDQAVAGALYGSYLHQGQVCMATNRVIVDASVHDAFVDRFVAAAASLRYGDPRDPGTQLGPVINARQLDSIRDKVSRAVEDGAELLLGGDPTGPTGQVLPPRVLLGDSTVATAAEEVFGPVATIIKADGEDHALHLANDTEYGLSSGVYTRDEERGIDFALRVQAGMTHINDTTVNDDVHIAFGGEKASGLGRFGGEWVVDEFTTHHWISVQHNPRDFQY